MYKTLFTPTSSGATVATHHAGTSGASVIALGGIQWQLLFDTTLGLNLEAATTFGARITLVDLPGRGQSRPAPLTTVDTWLADISEVYQSLVNRPSIWVGSSIGAWVMFLLQERNPAWFLSMCALAPAFDWDRNLPDKMPSQGTPPSELVRIDDSIRLPASLLSSMERNHIMDRPYALACAAHIILGTRDQWDRSGATAAFASGLGDRCTVELLDDDHRVAKLESDASRESFARWLLAQTHPAAATSARAR